MKNKLVVVLCFAISITISISIIIHAFYGAIAQFAAHAFLAAIFVGVTEIAYVSLPYISTLHKKSYLDKFYISLLFIISIMPAMMSSSSAYFEKQTKNAVAAPKKPIKSTLSETYQSQLAEINKTIAANNKQIQAVTNASVDATSDGIRFVSYRTKTYRSENKAALKQKSVYLEKIDNLDTEYAAAMKIYQTELHDFELKTKQSGINWLIDQMTLWYSLILVFILQIVNARFAYHGSALLGSIKKGEINDPVGDFVAETEHNLEEKIHRFFNKDDKTSKEELVGPGYDGFHIKPDKPWPRPNETGDLDLPESETPEIVEEDLSYDEKELADKVQIHDVDKKEEPLINTTEEVTHKETDLFTLSLSEFLKKFKVDGLGVKSTDKFCEMFNLKTTSDLNKFIKTVDYNKIIPRKFPKVTSDRFINLLTTIEGRWNNERTEHME